MKPQLKADLMLLVVTLAWGISYYLIDVSLEELTPFNLNALRFLMAFVIAGAATFPRLRTVNKATLRAAAILGFILMFVYIGATYGVKYTSLSNAGFLCALTVVIVPIFGYFFKGQRPGNKLIIVVLMALAGIALLTLNDQLQPALGDILCIFCAVFYAMHLLYMETAVQKKEIDAYQLGVFQLFFCGIYQLIVSVAIERPVLPETPRVWMAVIFLSIFCTGLSFIVQALAQQYTSATHVGVIFSLEPLFAGIVAFLLAGEVLSERGYLGAALLLASIFLMEIEWKKTRIFRLFVNK